MTTHSNTCTLAKQTAEIAASAPKIMAIRTARMLVSGLSPNAEDQHEFYQMSAEKVMVMSEVGWAMGTQMLQINQAFVSVWLSLLNPYIGFESLRQSTRQLERATLGLFTKSLEPVHKQVVYNAERLSQSSC